MIVNRELGHCTNNTSPFTQKVFLNSNVILESPQSFWKSSSKTSRNVSILMFWTCSNEAQSANFWALNSDIIAVLKLRHLLQHLFFDWPLSYSWRRKLILEAFIHMWVPKTTVTESACRVNNPRSLFFWWGWWVGEVCPPTPPTLISPWVRVVLQVSSVSTDP